MLKKCQTFLIDDFCYREKTLVWSNPEEGDIEVVIGLFGIGTSISDIHTVASDKVGLPLLLLLLLYNYNYCDILVKLLLLGRRPF